MVSAGPPGSDSTVLGMSSATPPSPVFAGRSEMARGVYSYQNMQVSMHGRSAYTHLLIHFQVSLTHRLVSYGERSARQLCTLVFSLCLLNNLLLPKVFMQVFLISLAPASVIVELVICDCFLAP